MPAFNTETFMEPNALTVHATAAALSAREVTSIFRATALPFPAELIRSATSCAPFSFISPRQTFAPWAA
ncbi:MAG: Uncharacterised protein [SAR116 cluster bacterium]|nr:MAG: Uncharacterised protein [SAR116 cluster bacterium]